MTVAPGCGASGDTDLRIASRATGTSVVQAGSVERAPQLLSGTVTAFRRTPSPPGGSATRTV